MSDVVPCTAKTCHRGAMVEVVWPGQGWIPYCMNHAAWAYEVLTVMGAWTEARRIPGAVPEYRGPGRLDEAFPDE